MDVSSITKYKNENVTEEQILGDFVLSASEYLNKISSNAVRSHMNILCGDILRIKNLTSGTAKTGNKRHNCEYCQTPWKYGRFSIKVVPSVKRGKKIRRIIRKIAQHKKVADVERNLAETADVRNKIIAKCHVCTKSSVFKTKTENKKSKKKNCGTKIIEAAMMIQNARENRKKKKKKKKQKNKFCGLNIDVMKQLNNSTTKDKNLNDTKLTDINGHNDEDDDVVIISQTQSEQNKGSVKSLKLRTEELACSTLGSETKNIYKHIKSKKLPINSSSPDVIPLDTTHNITLKTQKMFHKKNKLVNKSPKENQAPVHVNKKRKLNHWKKLMTEEEEKPLISRNLVDFLSAL